ncbi:MAG: hypothetical protein GDA43_18470 [Hormoscilla sp. SP5CHS1]|nr:hypothetical protein [Hormoscilla sp. SP12CHS1]MBC6454936.1 hypothetical protein [Hormoscilla sp. SP5CHS1]
MLQTSLFPTLASAKRSRKERMRVHAWHPYYAGYSEAFVSSAIAYLNLNSALSPLLLDPWNGSGTTGLVASRWGNSNPGIRNQSCNECIFLC